MSAHDDTPETDVRELFDVLAETATGATLTKLLARATEIPQCAKPGFGRFPRWAWASSVVGIAGLAGVLCMLLAERSSAPGGVPARAVAQKELVQAAGLTPPPVASVHSKLEPAWNGASNVAIDDPEQIDLIADLAPEFDNESPSEIEIDALSGPTADADLDAWLYATNKLLEGS